MNAIGLALLAVKKLMPHGLFIAWIESVGLTPSEAHQCMTLAIEAKGKDRRI